MTHRDLVRAVATRTGEACLTINSRGFSLVTAGLEEREPLAYDWDTSTASQLSELAEADHY